ncbi:MAG: nicotinamide-nucleotide adenylyltransferase [Patescibacteria group bacterium]
MTALFIGRFQPFHSGHLDAIKQISEKEIIIGIGSSQYSGTDDNPYSFEERKKMIEQALTGLDINYKIVAVPDIHDAKNWVAHVEKIVGRFNIVYTGNDLVRRLFEEKKYKVKSIKININISGTELRKKMKKYE